MSTRNLLCLLLVTAAICLSRGAMVFPPGFVFGSATAAYQVEGAFDVGGRGMSIWDTFSHTPGKTFNGETGDVADDFYHRFPADIAMMKALGLKHYRMSISWTRILPNGEGVVSTDGVAFYNGLFDALRDADITPYVTLFHWDSPQALEDEFTGWLDAGMAAAYANYAAVCFAAFGDRVKHWFTFNEPFTFASVGYAAGIHAPGRCSDRKNCDHGDSQTEPYLVVHNILRAHAMASSVYRTTYKASQGGTVAIVNNCDFIQPYSDAAVDVAASQRGLEFECGWFNDPIFFGDYPASMRARLGARLPSFTSEEKTMLIGSSDHIALNHYSSRYGADMACPQGPQASWSDEACVRLGIVDSRGNAIGPVAASSWLYVVPWGIRGILKWLKGRYNNTAIYVTENGVDEENTSPNNVLSDAWRIDFYTGYIGNVSAAINEDGVDVRGYFAWSLMDNFEWADGYSKRFGMVFVDFANGNTRTLKASAKWYSQLIANNTEA